MDTKWVHASGQSEDGLCLACELDESMQDEVPSEAHEPLPSPEASREEPYCEVCGHDIDMVEKR